MPVIVSSLSSDGAILDILVSPSRLMLKYGGGVYTYSALIDTGAEISFISPEVVARAVPSVVGRMYVNQSNGFSLNVATYDVRFRLGDPLTPGRWIDIEAPMIRPACPGIDVIIGRDLLKLIFMTWDGPGQSYQITHP